MAGPAGALHRARGRLQRRADRARERRPQRGDDGPDAAARRSDRLDAVLEFAELDEFVDLKLKNYSSGMLVRLAFSVMMQVDADILLIDEVLAVGDAAFQQKCADAFHEMKAQGKTIVLVTHEMDDGRGLLPPGDADRRRRRSQHDRRPGRGRATSTCGSTSSAQASAAADGRRAGRRARRCGCSTPGSRARGRRAGRPVEHGEELRSRGPSSRSCSDLRRTRASASCSPTPTASASPSSARLIDGEARPQLRQGRRAGHGQRRASRTRSSPGRYFVHCGVNRGARGAGDARSTSTTRSTSSSSAAASSPAGWSTLAARDRGRRSRRATAA